MGAAHRDSRQANGKTKMGKVSSKLASVQLSDQKSCALCVVCLNTLMYERSSRFEKRSSLRIIGRLSKVDFRMINLSQRRLERPVGIDSLTSHNVLFYYIPCQPQAWYHSVTAAFIS